MKGIENIMNPNQAVINPTLERMQSGTQLTSGERIDWTYYDTATLVSTTLSHRMFTVALGGSVGAGAAKTLAETNMEVQGLLPQGHKLFVRAIKLTYYASAVLDEDDAQAVFTVLEKTTLIIKPSGKDSLGTWKLNELMNSPMNAVVVPSVPGDNVESLPKRCVGIFPLNKVLILAALASFGVTVTHHYVISALTDGHRITVGLNGRLDRLS
jgi:hypothetical protein